MSVFEQQGEGSDSGDFTPTFDPVSPPPSEPGESPVKIPVTYDEPYSTSGGGSSASSTMMAGTLEQVGTDPFGNPIYTYVPSQIPLKYYDLNPGWNTRATIPEPIGSTMYLSYASGASVGAIVGLTENPAATAGYEDIILGWMTLSGVAHIIARGQILFQLPVATTMPEPGSYNRDVDQLVMRKTINKVEFFLSSEDGQGGEVKIGEAFMSEPVTYVSAALYLGGDVVENEVLEYPEVLAGSMAPLVGGFYESSSASYLTGQTPALTGEFYENDSSVMTGEIPAMAGFFGDLANAYMASSLPALSGSFMSASDALIVPDFNYTFAHIPPVFGAFMVRDTTFGTLGGSTPAVTGFFADQDVSVIRGALPALDGGFFDTEHPDRLMVVSFAYMNSQSPMRDTGLIVLNSSMEVVAAFTITEVQRLVIESEMQAGGSATLTAIIRELLMSTMSAGDVAALQRDGMSVWALHMDAGGSTRYENYDFNSFMTIDGQTYGVNAAGIARIGGTTDDGSGITSTVDFGSLNFGSGNRKSLPYVYVGMSSTGKTVLKVESDGSTYYYTARDATEQMKTHRFEPGRGLRSTFYGLSIVSDGKAFDLHNIDFQPVELKRSL